MKDASLFDDGFIRAYLAHASGVKELSDSQTELLFAFDDLVSESPAQALSLIIQIVSRTDSDRALAFIAAGPLENLLCKHGPLVLGKCMEEGKRSDTFKRCLTGVWGQNRMQSQVWDELQRFLGKTTRL